jgi:hypothetical protein
MAKRNKETIPDVDITLTARELKKLFNEPAELMKLYIFLNMRRDFDTNIAGQVTHINDSAFKEAMDYSGKPGRKAWRPSTKHIMRWLEQLENLGLIKPLGNYVFHLPLACIKKPSPESIQNQSHQFVTKTVTTGVTEKCLQEKEVLDSKNKGETLQQANDLSPEVSPQLESILGTPPSLIRSDEIRLEEENTEPVDNFDFAFGEGRPFYELLAKRGYYLNHMHHINTISMIETLVKKGVTPKEAAIAMAHCDAQLGKPPDVPWYYEKAIFQYRKSLQKSEQQAEEINNERNTARPTQPQATGNNSTVALLNRVRKKLGITEGN